MLGPSLGMTSRAQRPGGWPTGLCYLDHEREMLGGSWGVMPLPRAGRAGVVNLTQSEAAGQAGTFLRRLAPGAGSRCAASADAEGPPTQRGGAWHTGIAMDQEGTCLAPSPLPPSKAHSVFLEGGFQGITFFWFRLEGGLRLLPFCSSCCSLAHPHPLAPQSPFPRSTGPP